MKTQAHRHTGTQAHRHTGTQAHRYVIFVMVVFSSIFLNAQNTKDYLLEVKEGFELGEIQQAMNLDQTLTLTMANTGLANDLNTKQIFIFKKAFPKSQNPKLHRVYFLTVHEDTDFATTLQRAEIEKITSVDNEVILASNANSNFGMLPNDYDDIITGGRNTALDLINAPLAWTITTGDPNVVIGVVDAESDLNHEDLQGSIIETVIVDNYPGHHGAGVVGMINAQTDNNKGIASIAPDTKVAFVQCADNLASLTVGLTEVIDLKTTTYPNLKIVNCSWASLADAEYLQDVIYGENGIIENDMLIIAAAGNPNLSAPQIKQIIEDTADDIYHIPYNQPYVGQLGTGRINAFRAVKTAKCMYSPTPGLDLAMQNSNLDNFTEPDTDTEIMWNSEDIWVRNQNDGSYIDTHQNPEYDPNDPNYVYVRVTNNSCETSTGNDSLKLYWAKANTTLYWPENWDGTMYIEDPVTHENILMGDEVGTLNIPVLTPGESKIIEFEWDVPNPQDYINIPLAGNPWHFCLLARIVSLQDQMTFTEINAITQNVTNNNNIAWKNTTVVDIFPDIQSQIGGVVAVGNPFSTAKAFNLKFIKDSNEIGSAVYDEAEVSVEMDDVVYDAWVRGGKQGQNFTSTGLASKSRIATGNNMTLSNIMFDPNEIGTVYVKFNFLTSQLSPKKDFTYHAILRDAATNEIIGGETYEVHKRPRPTFDADAGNNETIDRSESVTITAAQINEAAVYNWYDPDGNLIYTGTDLTVSPDVTKTYRLEVITDTDGYKDYDEVQVTVNPYRLESIAPNPATGQVTVSYMADEASSAYLMVVSNVTGTSYNYILDINETTTNIDVSGYSSGLYSVALICDGVIEDTKTLAKQ